MKYKHKITGNIAELTQSGKNYKVTQPQNFTIPSWIIENSTDWEPMNVEYPLEYKDLRGGEYYSTEFTYHRNDTKKYTFKFGANLWYEHVYGRVKETDGQFHPGNGFHNFRIATAEERLPLHEKENGFRIIGMQISDYVTTLKAQRQLNNTFQCHPLDTKDNPGSSFKSMIESGWVISKVHRTLDDTEFELGDKFKSGTYGKWAEVIEFYFTHSMNGILVRGKADNDVEVIEHLQYCIKESEPVFITEDKVEVRPSCNYFGITTDFELKEMVANRNKEEAYIFLKRFCYKSLAEDWIIRNKPCLSLVDISMVYVSANTWDPKNPDNNRKQPKALY